MGRWRFEIEKHWTCSQHDYPEDGCECCGAGACQECETARWETTYDKDGWATMSFRPRSPMDDYCDQMIGFVVKELERPSPILTAMSRKATDQKPVINWIEN